MGPARLFPLLWTAWVVSWFGAAWGSGATEKRAGMRREIGYRAVLFIGAILFGIPAHGHEGVLRLWHVHRVEAWVCLAVTLGGFAFCWWGRVHLGRLWSGRITKKEGHCVVDTGPHGIVRHPIYIGILLAVFATIAAKGTAALRIAGGLLLATGLWMKARLEERWMRSELGALTTRIVSGCRCSFRSALEARATSTRSSPTTAHPPADLLGPPTSDRGTS